MDWVQGGMPLTSPCSCKEAPATSFAFFPSLCTQHHSSTISAGLPGRKQGSRTMAPKQAAQAQAVKTAEITQQESLELVKCLLRVSVYHVSFMRGLFPDSQFKGVDMHNLDDMHIKMLNAKDEAGSINSEATMLIQWVEHGVMDAIGRKYLRSMIFGIGKDADGKDLLEEYVFSFNYDSRGRVAMAVGATIKNKQYGASQEDSKGPNVSSVKYQVVRLMRMLVTICQTLEKVPDERYLFMKLTYYDHAPNDYEPPCFEAAGHRATGAFPHKPFTLKCGSVETNHHQLTCAVKSVLDSVHVADQEPELDCVSQQSCGSDVSEGDTAEEGMGGFSPGQQQGKARDRVKLADLYTVPPEATALPGEDDAGSCMVNCSSSLEEMRQYLAKRPHLTQLHVVDAMCHFTSMPSEVLANCFEQLVKEGVLERTAEAEVFGVVRAREEEAVVNQMTSLAVGTARPLASNVGGVHSVAGTQQTLSQEVTKRKAAQREAERGEEEENSPPGANLWVDGTQHSGMAGAGAAAVAPRKTSFVEATIHQQAKRARRGGDGNGRRGRMTAMR